MDFEIQVLNDTSLLLRFGDSIDHRLPKLIARISQTLHGSVREAITDLIPSYTTLLVVIDTTKISLYEFEARALEELAWLYDFDFDTAVAGSLELSSEPPKTIIIPVFYDISVAPDLQRMAYSRGLLVDDIVDLHSSKTYTVFTLGFAPGFAFMGSVDPRIAEPRLSTPRSSVAKGSVGIAGEQTGVYPTESPGGWNIIGRTPRRMFWVAGDGQLNCPVCAGDEVKFKAISLGEYQVLQGTDGD